MIQHKVQVTTDIAYISENRRLILPCHPAIMPRLVFLPGYKISNQIQILKICHFGVKK